MNTKRLGIISGVGVGLAALGYGGYRLLKARNASKTKEEPIEECD
jgi:hypothetical protein